MQCFILIDPPWVGRTLFVYGHGRENIDSKTRTCRASSLSASGSAMSLFWSERDRSYLHHENVAKCTSRWWLEQCHIYGDGNVVQRVQQPRLFCPALPMLHRIQTPQLTHPRSGLRSHFYEDTATVSLSPAVTPSNPIKSKNIVSGSALDIADFKCCKMVCFWLCHSDFIQHFGRNMNQTRPVLTFS